MSGSNFSDDQLGRLAELLGEESAELAPIQPIARQSSSDGVPLSFAQQRLWFLDQLQHGSPEYNISMAYRLKGDLQVSALEHSLNAIVNRHETLRTFIRTDKGQAVQVIAP